MIEKSDIDRHLKEIGGRLREHRKSQGLRLADLSLVSGLTEASISNIERGKRDVKLSRLLALAHALRVMPGHLFQDGAELIGNGGR